MRHNYPRSISNNTQNDALNTFEQAHVAMQRMQLINLHVPMPVLDADIV
jgi:hypothetical protein